MDLIEYLNSAVPNEITPDSNWSSKKAEAALSVLINNGIYLKPIEAYDQAKRYGWSIAAIVSLESAIKNAYGINPSREDQQQFTTYISKVLTQ
jgi:hypothetical protein